MTTIKTTITLDDVCTLTVTDITGFYSSPSNLTGFLPEGDSSSLAFNVYKISHGYFLNTILASRYNLTPTIFNPTESLIHIDTGSVNPTYASNFTPTVYTLIKDGTYTARRYFIPSIEFYNANHTNSIYNGKTMYYYDGADIYKIISSVATKIILSDFVLEDLTDANVIYTDNAFISLCKNNNCYFTIMSTILDLTLIDCEDSNEFARLSSNRDLLYMSLEVIKYLQDQNNITQIQKLIESLDACALLCTTTSKKTSSTNSNTNCGCG